MRIVTGQSCDTWGMSNTVYCRKCHHDLRGQGMSQCPECAHPFDPQDEATYLLSIPTGLQTLFRSKALKILAKLLAIAALYGIAISSFLWALRSSNGTPLSGRAFSCSLLHSIVQAHLGNADLSSEDGTLTVEDVRHDLKPSWYSRSVEPQYARMNKWCRHATDILRWSVLAIAPALCALLLARRWLRKLAIAMVLTCALLILFSLSSAFIVAGSMPTPSYAYLDDYVLVSGIDWQSSPSCDKIVAFEKHPWAGRYRVVAKNAWMIRVLRESKFQALLSEQPLASRAWDKCLARGECIHGR